MDILSFWPYISESRARHTGYWSMVRVQWRLDIKSPEAVCDTDCGIEGLWLRKRRPFAASITKIVGWKVIGPENDGLLLPARQRIVGWKVYGSGNNVLLPPAQQRIVGWQVYGSGNDVLLLPARQRIPRWATSPTCHSYGLTSFWFDNSVVTCSVLECTMIWIWIQRSNKCNWPYLKQCLLRHQ